jgi:hypothetical protein
VATAGLAGAAAADKRTEPAADDAEAPRPQQDEEDTPAAETPPRQTRPPAAPGLSFLA